MHSAFNSVVQVKGSIATLRRSALCLCGCACTCIHTYMHIACGHTKGLHCNVFAGL